MTAANQQPRRRSLAALVLAVSLTAGSTAYAQAPVPAGDVPPLAPAEPELGDDVRPARKLPAPGVETEAETVAKSLADSRSADAEIRYRAVLVLSKYENDVRAQRAVSAALGDPAAKVRRAAVVSLIARASGPGDAQTMLLLLGDADDSIRRLVSSHLPRLLLSPPPPDPRLGPWSDRLPPDFEPRLGARPDRLPPDFEPLLGARPDRLPPGVEPLLVRAFTDQDATVRKNVLSAVGAFRAVAVANAGRIAGLLQDPERDVRSLALEACRNLLPPAAFVTRAKPLVNDPDPKIRLRLAQLLVYLNASERQDLLRTLAQDTDFAVATEAAIGLLDTGEAQVWADLRQRLDDPRLNAEQALRIIERVANMGAGAQPALEGLLRHERAAYRAAALGVYGRVAGPNPDQALLLGLLADPALAVRQAAGEQLVRVRQPAATELRDLAKSPHADVRLLALTLSNRLANNEVGDLALDLLVDDQPSVRGAALAILARRQLGDWQPILREALADTEPAVRRQAADALLANPTAAATNLLEDYRRHGGDTDLRQYLDEQLRLRELLKAPRVRPAPQLR